MKATPDLLMAKRGESHPTERADLFGKRFVACIESDEGKRLAEALVKEMTGGDRMRGRFLYQNNFEWEPTHHIWLASNYKPTIYGNDRGIWRRIKLIPFDVVIPDHKADRQLPDKLAAELPGILNWAIAGCLDWQWNGMREPQLVQVATSKYESESEELDEIKQFVDDHCERGDFVASATELYQTFQRLMPNQKISQATFGKSLRKQGFEKARTNIGKHGWKGLRFREENDHYSQVSQQVTDAIRSSRSMRNGTNKQ